jgi:replicative superfamily II helicase
MFQQPNSANWVGTLINNQQIDFIVIDEIHYTKQRQVEDMSGRKQLVNALITAATEHNPDLHVIGMSATPVINNLQEGKS